MLHFAAFEPPLHPVNLFGETHRLGLLGKPRSRPLGIFGKCVPYPTDRNLRSVPAFYVVYDEMDFAANLAKKSHFKVPTRSKPESRFCVHELP